MWAWEERTKSIDAGGTGNRRAFFRSLSPPPWNIPQSIDFVVELASPDLETSVRSNPLTVVLHP